MGLGAGIASQFGFAQETTPGTPVTVTKFVEYNTETLDFVPNTIQGMGLHAGGQYARASRYSRTTKTVSGAVTMDLATRTLGVLLKNMLGSSATATQISATTAYKQVHNPGPLDGLGLTLQKGVPEAGSGTVKPYTYNGAKVTSWTISQALDAIATLSIGFDAWNEDDVTALATASYVASNVFNFSQVTTIKFGGTASIASGVTSIASGVAVTGLTSFELTGTNPVADSRFFLGSAGVKANQLENDYRTVSGKFSGEFSKAQYYDVFKAGTTTPIQVTWTQGDAGGGNAFTFDIILPACKLNSGTNNVGGPDIIQGDIEFVALDDQATTPIQITYISTDTSL
jgi:hypothetical protein